MTIAKPSISIITATYNAELHLPHLIASLRTQTDHDFEWIVVDGRSSDRSVELLGAADDIVTHWLSEPDFGIYDALNKGVRLASGDYYLVLGADDVLAPQAIEYYRSALTSTADLPDIVTACVKADGLLLTSRGGRPWLYGQSAYISNHSIGALIRRGLHQSLGYYSRKFPICADHLFIKKVVLSGGEIRVMPFVAGEFGKGGVSSTDELGVMTEFFRVQFATEKNKLLQLLLFMLRLVKKYSLIKDSRY